MHEVPVVTHAVASAIVGVVQVREAQTVWKLVADGAHTVLLATRCDLVCACVCVDHYAIDGEGFSIVALWQVEHMWPDVVFATWWEIGLAHACIDNKHLIGLAIAIPVVVGKVYLVFNGVAGVGHHFAHIHIVAILVVLAIVGIVFLHGDRAHDVEGEVELSVALVVKIVVYTAHKVAFGIVFFVGNVVVFSLVVFGLKLGVGKIDQDDKTLFLSVIAIRADARALRVAPCAGHALAVCGLAACYFGTTCASLCAQSCHVGHAVCAVAVASVACTIVGKVKLEVLVATELCSYLGAVVKLQRCV